MDDYLNLDAFQRDDAFGEDTDILDDDLPAEEAEEEESW